MNLGIAALAAGIVLTLGSHLLGSRLLVSSDTLGDEVPCYDAYPKVPEMGRVVLYCESGPSIQDHFSLALPLLRSGYAVRFVARSGSQDSGVAMSHESPLIESREAALPFPTDLPNSPMDHGEVTRYAAEIARDVPSVDGVAVVLTASASMNALEPANILTLGHRRRLL